MECLTALEIQVMIAIVSIALEFKYTLVSKINRLGSQFRTFVNSSPRTPARRDLTENHCSAHDRLFRGLEAGCFISRRQRKQGLAPRSFWLCCSLIGQRGKSAIGKVSQATCSYLTRQRWNSYQRSAVAAPTSA